jgi:hypothetical protein
MQINRGMVLEEYQCSCYRFTRIQLKPLLMLWPRDCREFLIAKVLAQTRKRAPMRSNGSLKPLSRTLFRSR